MVMRSYLGMVCLVMSLMAGAAYADQTAYPERRCDGDGVDSGVQREMSLRDIEYLGKHYKAAFGSIAFVKRGTGFVYDGDDFAYCTATVKLETYASPPDYAFHVRTEPPPKLVVDIAYRIKFTGANSAFVTDVSWESTSLQN